MNSQGGSAQKFIRATQFNDMLISIPKSKHKITEWVDKISKPYDKKNNNQELIIKLEEDIKNKIKDIEENEECDEVELGSICEIKSGNHTTNKSDFKDGLYPIIGGGIKPIGFHNEYNCDENTILCASHGTVGLLSMYPIKTFLTMCFGIIIKDNKIKLYVYNYLKYIRNEIINLGNGSTLKCLTKHQLMKIKIKIPKDKKLINNFEPLFNEIEKLKIELKETELEYTQLIKELSEEAIPTNKIHIEKIISKNTEDVEEINEILSNNEDIEKNKNNDDKQINLEKKSKKELEKICKDKCIIFKSKDKKQILIEKIINHKD
jgi:hypothetical protein